MPGSHKDASRCSGEEGGNQATDEESEGSQRHLAFVPGKRTKRHDCHQDHQRCHRFASLKLGKADHGLSGLAVLVLTRQYMVFVWPCL